MPESFWHPMLLIPEGWFGRYWVLLVSGVMTAALIAALLTDGRELGRRGYDIVAFELAGTPDVVNRIFSAWEADGRAVARRNVWLDFPFILAYGVFFSTACVACTKSAAAVGMFDPRIGVVLAWGVLAACLCDVIEDIALLSLFPSGTVPAESPFPRVAQVAAITKFALLFASWYYPIGVGVSVIPTFFISQPSAPLPPQSN